MIIIGTGHPEQRIPNDRPAFSVHRADADQTGIVQGSFQKLKFTSKAGEGFDSHGYFDLSNNFYYQPKIPGYYMFMVSARWNFTAAGATRTVGVRINKNGTTFWTSAEYVAVTLPAPTMDHDAVVYLNGSTDYVQFDVYQDTGANQDLIGTTSVTHAMGFRIADPM
jgi:hypothetical protein